MSKPTAIVSRRENQQGAIRAEDDDYLSKECTKKPRRRNCDVTHGFKYVLVDCRLRIVEYLRPHELYGGYALSSKQCHMDSQLPTLSHRLYGEVFCGDDIARLFRRLSSEPYQRAFQHPRHRLKLVGHERLQRADLSVDEATNLASRAVLRDVTALDLSLPPACGGESFSRTLVRCVPWMLSMMLPQLRELDMSNIHGGPLVEGDFVSELSFFDKDRCPNLTVVRWPNRVGGCHFLRGKDLQTLKNLRELYLDNIFCNSDFDGVLGHIAFRILGDDEYERCILFGCNTNLERVSVSGATFKVRHSTSYDQRELFPQNVLMKFVRKTASLKWFKSDLSSTNVALLQKERPDVHFVD